MEKLYLYTQTTGSTSNFETSYGKRGMSLTYFIPPKKIINIY